MIGMFQADGFASTVLAVMTLQAGYNSAVVLLGTTFLGIAAGVVGTFTFLRKRALIADALSHATLPGIGLAFLVGIAIGIEGRSLLLLLLGAAATGALGVLLVQLIVRHTRITEDAAIGIVLSVFYGIGIVLLSYVQNLSVGGQAGLKTFILGQTAAMSRNEAIGLGVLALLAVGATVLLFKEFRLVCFDSDFAQGQGWPVFRIDLAMAGLTVFITVIGLQTVGLILIVALLILPPVAARFWSESLPRIMGISAAFGGISGFFGATLSAALPDVPAGAVIVLVAGAFFLISILVAPARGIVATAVRLAWLRLRLQENKALSRLLESRTRDMGRLGTAMSLWLAARGVIDPRTGALTDKGIGTARHAARNLALWEAYLGEGIDGLPARVNWGVDPIDAVLSRDHVARLERGLTRARTVAP